MYALLRARSKTVLVINLKNRRRTEFGIRMLLESISCKLEGIFLTHRHIFGKFGWRGPFEVKIPPQVPPTPKK